ncbi:MAG: methionyl-tRNA formyltransferase [bacterium]
MMNKKTTKIIFIGTAEFAAVILNALIRDDWSIKLIITQPDRPIGRHQILTPPPVKIEAQKHNANILQPPRIADAFDQIKKIEPDLIIAAAYSQLIPKKILALARLGSLNIHPSLLPRYRGPTPIQTAILNGEKSTGVTIILMDEKIDHGPIVAQRELKNYELRIMNYGELNRKLAELGGDLLVETLPKFLKGEIIPLPQDETKATYTKILTKDDGKIDWQKKAKAIERQIRAYNPWPGSWTEFNLKEKIKKLKITRVEILETEKPNGEIGKLFLTENKKMAVTCGQGSLILEKVQPEGKTEMIGSNFHHGYGQIKKLG